MPVQGCQVSIVLALVLLEEAFGEAGKSQRTHEGEAQEELLPARDDVLTFHGPVQPLQKRVSSPVGQLESLAPTPASRVSPACT